MQVLLSLETNSSRNNLQIVKSPPPITHPCWDFYQFDRCQPESGDSSLTAKIGLSLVGPILHTANELSTLYPIALDCSRLIVYSCPHRASLCLTHHPHPAFLQSPGDQGAASLFHRYHVLRNMVVRPLSPTDKNAPRPHLQKGSSPFGCQPAGSTLGRHSAPFYISQNGADLEQMIDNVISSDYV